MSTRDAQRLAAGLLADERVADGLAFACRLPDRVPDFTAAGGPAAEQFWARFTARRELDEVAAKRAILALCESEMDETGGRPLAIRIMHLLAGVYQDTPAETVTPQS